MFKKGLFSCLIFFFLCVYTLGVSAQVRVSIMVPYYVMPGGELTAEIEVAGVTELDTAYMVMSYDPKVLQFSGVTSGSLTATAMPTANTQVSGQVRILVNLPGVEGASGTGSIAKVGFRAVGSKGSYSDLKLTEVFLGDTLGKPIPTQVEPPARVTVAMVGLELVSPDRVSKGDIITIILSARDVMSLDTVMLTLSYDESMLQYTGIHSGSLTGAATPVVNTSIPGQIQVVMNLPGVSGASGTGSLVSFDFRVVGEAGSSSIISLADISLGDVNAYKLPAGEASPRTLMVREAEKIIEHSITPVGIVAPYYVMPGGELTAEIEVSGAAELDTAYMVMSYDPAVLQFSGVVPGSLTAAAMPTANTQVSGQVRILVNLPGVGGASGTGSIAKVGFRAVGSKGSYSDLKLTEVFLGDTLGKPIPTQVESPARVTVAMVGLELVSPDRVSKGDTIAVTLSARDVMSLDTVMLTLSYDESMLQYVGIHSGSLTGAATPVVNTSIPGQIQVVMNLPGVSGASGTGSLVSFDFRVIGEADNTSIISLADISLGDVNAYKLPAGEASPRTLMVREAEKIIEHSITPVGIVAPYYVMPGGELTAEIEVAGAAELDTAYMVMSYDPVVLQFSGVVPGSLTAAAMPTANTQVSGQVRILVNLPGVEGASGTGSIAKVEFDIIGTKGSYSDLKLTEVSLGDTLGKPIPTQVESPARVTVMPMVELELDAPDIELKGEIITVTLNTKEVTSLDTVMLTLSYNEKVLQFDGAYSGLLTNAAIPIVNTRTPGRTQVVMNLPGVSGASGTGSLVSFDFRVIGEADNTSIISLADVSLGDVNAHKIPAQVPDSRTFVVEKPIPTVNIIINAPRYIMPGETLKAGVNAEGLVGLDTAYMVMGYDPKVLQVIGVTSGRLIPTATLIANTQVPGQVSIHTDLPGTTGVSGTGSIAVVEFKAIISKANSDLEMTETIFGNIRGKTIPTQIGPSARVIVTPAVELGLASPDTASKGDTITVTLDVKEVTNLDSVKATLGYDERVLQFDDVHSGSLTKTATPTVSTRTPVQVQITIDLPGVSGTSGSGSLASFDFRVTGEADRSCLISLTYSSLADVDGYRIPIQMPASRTFVVAIPAAQVIINAPYYVTPDGALTAEIEVRGVTELDTAYMVMNHDAEVLQFSGVTPGSLTATAMPTADIQTPGQVRLSLDLPGVSGVSGTGSIAMVEFKAIGSKGSYSDLKLTELTLSNIRGKTIPEQIEPPARVTIAMVELGLLSPDTASKGDNITVTLDVKEVTNLDAVTATLGYDEKALQFDDVHSGSLTKTATPTVSTRTPGQIQVTMNLPGTGGASGTGSLAIFDFRVIGEADRSCLISLTYSSLADVDGYRIPIQMPASRTFVVAIPAAQVIINAPYYVIPDGSLTAEIEVRGVTELDTAYMIMNYDAEVLQFSGVTPGSLTATAMPTADIQTPGQVRLSLDLLGVSGISGTGSIAIVEFKAIGSKGSYSDLKLTELTLSNIRGKTIPEQIEPPARVTIAMVELELALPDTASKGDTITVTLDVKEVTNLDAVTATLSYDEKVLQFDDVHSGSLTKAATPTVSTRTPGQIQVVMNLPGVSGASGSGSLASFDFRVVGEAGSSSLISLDVISLGDVNAHEIPAQTIASLKLSVVAKPVISGAPLADTPWPMKGHDVKHTGQSPYKGPANPGMRWKIRIGDSINSSPSIGPDGTIYIGSMDNNLYAINPDGSLKWKFQTEYCVYSSPAIDSDGTIYVGSMDSCLYAIKSDGSLKWRFKSDAEIYSSPAIGSDGTIYTGSADSYLYAINPDGSLKWKFKADEGISSSPAIGSDGIVYVGSMESLLYAIKPDGKFMWRSSTGLINYSSPAVGLDGTVYIGAMDGGLYAVYPDAGARRWKFHTGGSIYSSPAVGSDGIIYVGSKDNYLYAIKPDGNIKWKFLTRSDVNSSPIIDSEGTVYVGSFDNHLYAINPDGSLKWKFMLEAPVFSAPVIDSDGTIYVGQLDGYVYAIGSTKPEEPAEPEEPAQPEEPTKTEEPEFSTAQPVHILPPGRIITPAYEGHNDILTVIFRGDVDVSSHFAIYDLGGFPVYAADENSHEVYSNGWLAYTWNGRAYNNPGDTIAEDGIYVYILRVNDKVNRGTFAIAR